MIKHHVGVPVEKNSFVDNGDGIISFPNGLVITDDTIQRNNTRYDITSMDLSEYKGQITADHTDMVSSVIGKVTNLVKRGNQVVIDGIKFAVKENALARLTYDLFKGGYLSDVSIETYGSPPDEEGIYRNARLVGLSVVVVGNNRTASAALNSLVKNSIQASKKDGLKTEELEKNFLDESQKNSNINNNEVDMFVTIKNSRKFAVEVKYTNAAGDDVTRTVEPGDTVDVSEEQKDVVQTQLDEATAPKGEGTPDGGQNDGGKDGEGADEAQNSIEDMIKNALGPVTAELESFKTAFNKSATEPQFRKNGAASAKNEFGSMDWRDRHAKQINAAWDLLVKKDPSAHKVLNDINTVNLTKLKADGVVQNSMTLGDFGNFVISREMLTEIEGQRNDYTPLISATNWRETLSTQMAWISRTGDINMQEVEFCDDDENGNLKPISEYGASVDTANLHELAAVTPVCNAATRFLAVDLLGDVAAGYRSDYDRKRAQLVIARLEQAVEGNGNSVIYDTNPNVEALASLLSAYARVAQTSPNGTFILNNSSYANILGYALKAGISGPLSQIFTTGDQPRMFGRPYIVVSDDLMPSLDTAGTVTISVEGQNITVNHAVFYADLTKFTGRTSGGLQYDLSTDAAYEDGGIVKSAFQRNELLLRGSFFRGGAITDPSRVAGILAPGVS